MRLALTESVRKFIDTLDEQDLSKVTITEDTFESNDETIITKFDKHIKDRFQAVGEKIKRTTEQFKEEHPEYFN